MQDPSIQSIYFAMNAKARTSISRLIDDLSTPQDDDQSGSLIWKPTAAKLVDLELKYTSPPSAALNDSCRPWNYDDYLNRLATYRESSRWFAKPSCLSPLQCALLGWSCSLSKRDSLVCHCCKATLKHNTLEDASGEALRAQLTTGHAENCGWGCSAKDAVLGQAPTMCSPSFADIPGVQSAWKLSEFVVTRLISLVDMLLISPVATTSTSISLRGLLPGHAGSRSIAIPHNIPSAELASLKLQLEDLERRMRSTGRAGSHRAAWLQSEGAKSISSAVHWLVHPVDQDQRDPNSGEDAPQSEQLVRALLVIALGGWSAPAAAPSVIQNTGGASVVGSIVTAAVAAAPTTTTLTTTSATGAVCCRLCGRAVSLSTTAELELLNQHRYFCTVINPQSEVPTWVSLSTTKDNQIESLDNKKDSVALGWEYNLKAVLSIFRHEPSQLDGATSVVVSEAEKACASPGEKHALSPTGNHTGNPSGNDNTDNICGDVSPEQVYKRIRSVLAMAAANRS